MKTINFKKLVKGVLISAALVTSVVACGNKNKDNPNMNAYQMSCANCGDISGIPFYTVQTTVQSMSFGQNAMRLNLSFSGQNTQQPLNQGQSTGQYSYYSPASMTYTGKVSAIGTAAVSYQMNLGMCPQLPAGNYNVATQTVGMWNGNGSQAQVSGIRLVLTKDNITAYATLSNVWAIEYPYSSYSSSTRMSGNFIIEQVNGYWCQNASFYLY
jgi:hypothetical protein